MPDPISFSLTAASQHPTGHGLSRAARGAYVAGEILGSDPAKGFKHTPWAVLTLFNNASPQVGERNNQKEKLFSYSLSWGRIDNDTVDGSRLTMVLSQTLTRDASVTVLQFQTSCFRASHAQQHSVRYASCIGSGGTTCAPAPCDFNWMIGCNSISNRGTTRVSMRRKPKEHWWLESLSTAGHHLSYLLG